MRRFFASATSGGVAGKTYEIEGRRFSTTKAISEGGFAFVVEVRDLEDGNHYALKKITCQDKEGLVAAEREVDLLGNLVSHKNIVSFFGHTVVKQRHGVDVLLLLELCDRHLVDHLAEHKGVLPETELVKAFTDVAEAIFCLHSHDPRPIQHRDLKLENVLRGKDGLWKVCDFGSWSDEPIDFSAAAPKELALMGEEVARWTTMMYRPPEMVDLYMRLPINCAVDIWMLGCIFYTLMFNKHPFQEAATLAIRYGRYDMPRRAAPLPAKYTELLVWLLSVDPRERPSARSLVMMLWQWQDLGRVELPPSVRERYDALLAPRASDLKAAAGRHSAPPSKSSRAAAPAGAVPAEPAHAPELADEADWGDFAGADWVCAPMPPPAAGSVAAAGAGAAPEWVAFADFEGAAEPEPALGSSRVAGPGPPEGTSALGPAPADAHSLDAGGGGPPPPQEA